MPAKSFLGEIEEAARHFYATSIRGEVSDANVRGYLRAASQIEDIWQQIDARLAELSAGGLAPWEAFERIGFALAFIRAARAYQVAIRELLAADAAADPATIGYLPRVTFDQANAFAHQIQPNLQQAVAAITDSTYRPDVALPLEFGPRIEAEDACPVAHLQGMIAATREVREWAAGLLSEYTTAVQHAAQPAPAAITSHIEALGSRLARADAQLRFATDLVGEVSRGEATTELHESAEDSLWEALRELFLLNQAIALPSLLHPASTIQQPAVAAAPQRDRTYHDRKIHPEDLWSVAASSARADVRGTPFGTDEMEEMCEKMGGVLSAGAQHYLDDVKAAVARGAAIQIAAMANCPFEPLYRARTALQLAGAKIPVGHEFHWNFHRGHIESAAHFGRVDDWQECEE